MEYRKTTPLVYNPKVREIQSMLNRARDKARALILEDFQNQGFYKINTISNRFIIEMKFRVIGKYLKLTDIMVIILKKP